MVATAILDVPSIRRSLISPLPGLGPLPPGAAAIVALADAGCRWPIGEVAEDGFSFCGSPRSRGSYCAAHRLAAYAGVRR